MTIEEIKEIRATVLPTEQEYFDAHSVEMVDTLLAEVQWLENKMINWPSLYDECVTLNNKLATATSQLAVATEALDRIAGNLIDGCACDIIADCKDYTEALEMMARTALERIKG
jgi:hypothetical protein